MASPFVADKLAPIVAPNVLPFFVFKYFILGFIFLIAAIVFTLAAWGAMRRNFADGYRLKALLIVCIDIVLLAFGISFLNSAFPRVPGFYIIAGLGVLFLVTTGGGVAVKSKDAGADKPGQEKK